MRANLAGLLRNGASCIRALARDIREREGFDLADGDLDETPGHGPELFNEAQPDFYVYGLDEAAKHARETAAGKHTVAEFADFYGLSKATPLVITEADVCPLSGCRA